MIKAKTIQPLSSSNSSSPSPRVALILAGCGAKDGTEITEAVSLMVALGQESFVVEIFAPNRNAYHVIDHTNNEVCLNETRNILTEASRIARGKIKGLEELKHQEFDVLAFPGGFGVAKNLCDFAIKGEKAKLHDDIREVLVQFIQNNKIIATLCIAPILLALIAKELGMKQATITLGHSQNEASKIAQSWGIKVEDKQVQEACIDSKNKFVSSPAYMDDKASAADIFASAVALVKGIQQLV